MTATALEARHLAGLAAGRPRVPQRPARPDGTASD